MRRNPREDPACLSMVLPAAAALRIFSDSMSDGLRSGTSGDLDRSCHRWTDLMPSHRLEIGNFKSPGNHGQVMETLDAVLCFQRRDQTLQRGRGRSRPYALLDESS